jgi:tRNA (guanine37-N1)-methyltransferase
MRFDVLTIFPGVFSAYLGEGIVGRAVQNGFVDVRLVNIRDFTQDVHQTTDDRPYGGGDGMVMKPGPIYRALGSVDREGASSRVILLSPQGQAFDQSTAWELATWNQVILVCGRYEGVDERIITSAVDLELSVGDYVLSGGELGALIVIDAVTRLIPGVLGGERSAQEDSFEEGLLKYPQYTRPRVFRGEEVPQVLLSGDHAKIRSWRRKEALKRTLVKRPDLLDKAVLSEEDATVLADLRQSTAILVRAERGK